jgi:putative SOS response-associated peptidase YedK
MCGRFVVATSPQSLAEHFGVDEVWVDAAEPDYNVAPTEQVMVVRERTRDGHQQRVLSHLRWGLVPSWSKDPSTGNKMINARAETLTTKAAYKNAFVTHRCIIPADGFYEWRVVAPPATPKGRARKQPLFVRRRDGDVIAFAGLWAAWKVPEGREEELGAPDGWLRSCTIITTEPNALLAPVHDRMPAVLHESSWDEWLDPEERDTGALSQLIAPAPDDALEMWPVGPLVNKPEHKGPEVINRVDPEP